MEYNSSDGDVYKRQLQAFPILVRQSTVVIRKSPGIRMIHQEPVINALSDRDSILPVRKEGYHILDSKEPVSYTHLHVALVQDISPNCDCHGENDAPILPDIGMFASFDPVALDQACADACLKATPIENSQLGEHLAKPDWHCHHDHFKDSNPNIEWQATLDQAEKIGLGTRQYELKIVK